MNPLRDYLLHSRRGFLANTAGGIGTLALASLLRQDGLLAMPGENALAPQKPHFAPRAKNCIYIYLYGGASHIDLFDPKPKLNELDGQPLPESLSKQFVRVAGSQTSGRKQSPPLLASPRRFRAHGQCGMELSDLLPHLAGCVDDMALIRSMHTQVFNHAPGELVSNTGLQTAGHPSVGAWLTYGLGSETQDLPGYAVFVMGSRVKPYTWSNGFLPSPYQGVRFYNRGEPVPDLRSPRNLPAAMQREQLDAVRDLNQLRRQHTGDPEITGRIASYELAYRMQIAAPQLFDLAGETRPMRQAYGVDRPDADSKIFSTNCLLARRMVERGVRFVHLIHSSWDFHEKLEADLPRYCRIVDQPIAALLKDLKQRGLLDTTLVVLATEFGRTPMVDFSLAKSMGAGRDHHPFAFSVWLAGGGAKGGQVIGKTDEIGFGVVEDPVHYNDLHATLLHLFGFDHEKLTYRHAGRDFRLTDVAGQVVEKVLA